jgi:transcriptional regulator with XRE-family HTH domain
MADPLSEATRVLGERIRGRRLELGATQEEVAFGAGIDPTTLSKIELGERNIHVHNLVRIAAAIGWDPAELVRDMTADMVPERDRRPDPVARLEKRLRDQAKRGARARPPSPDKPWA